MARQIGAEPDELDAALYARPGARLGGGAAGGMGGGGPFDDPGHAPT